MTVMTVLCLFLAQGYNTVGLLWLYMQAQNHKKQNKTSGGEMISRAVPLKSYRGYRNHTVYSPHTRAHTHTDICYACKQTHAHTGWQPPPFTPSAGRQMFYSTRLKRGNEGVIYSSLATSDCSACLKGFRRVQY